MKGVIPIGGRGTRMRPVTFSQNKHFIPVANKLLIEYPIQTLVEAGITEIAITYNPGQLEYAKGILGDGEKWGVRFTYILQPEPKGLANIYEVCEKWIGDGSFVLHLGDNIFTEGIKKFVEYFEQEQPDGLIAMLEHPQNERMGVPYFDDNGQVYKLVEKPDNPPHKYAMPGVYFMNNRGFEVFKGEDRLQPSARGEYEIPDAFQWLIDHDYRVDVLEYEGTWLDPGKFDDWIETNQYLLDVNTKEDKIELDEDNEVQGRVEIGENTTIKNSVIRGPVRIGDNVTIRDSFIGPFTSIYHGCEIEGCRIENSVFMGDVTVSNFPETIDTSILGSESTVTADPKKHKPAQLFIGEMSTIKL